MTDTTPTFPPQCVVVTGPRGAGKTRWIARELAKLSREQGETLRAAVILAEEGRTRLEDFVRTRPGVALQKLILPCPCCPAAADLPGRVRRLTEATGARWMFLELPAIEAMGLLAEFDAGLVWPRNLVVRLNSAWRRMLGSGMLTPFQSALLQQGTQIVDEEDAPAQGWQRADGTVPDSVFPTDLRSS